MTYQWKMDGLYSIPAQAAGVELDRIYQSRGRLDAPDIVDESRPETAVLHPCFEWDNPIAAERWREHQARKICNCIVVVDDSKPKEQETQIRAFVHACGTYHPTPVVVNDEEKYQDLVRSILQEFRAIRKKHAAFSDRSELQAIFSAIDSASA